MTDAIEHVSRSARQTAAAARRFARTIPRPPLCVHLCGELGAGKTLWARALIAALGGGEAQSPGYALALSYRGRGMTVHHMDLFRLPSGAALPGELMELIDDSALTLVEWPERAPDLPPPDVKISLHAGAGEEDARRIVLTAQSERGGECLRGLSL